MIFEDKNTSIVARILSVKESSGQTADPPSNDDQIVGFVLLCSIVPGLAVPGGMRNFERPRMASAQSAKAGRIVRTIRGRNRLRLPMGRGLRDSSCPNREAHPVKEVAPGDAPVHSKEI